MIAAEHRATVTALEEIQAGLVGRDMLRKVGQKTR
jgi:hypothetical protein